MRRTATYVPCFLLMVASACEQDAADGDFGFDTPTGGTMVSMTATTAGSVGSSEAGSGSEDSGTTAQGGSTGSTGTGADEGSTTEVLPTEPCTTLDILFVVDNSDTMADEQVRLGAAIGPFIELVNQQLPGVAGSIQVAVITTDASEFVTTTPTAVCTPYASAATWMAYGPTIATELQCAAAVGTMGDPDERPMQWAADALSPAMQGPGGFNGGFLREQGPLVVVVVTDEEDDLEAITQWGSPGDPADWVLAIAASQGGFVQNVIPLLLVGVEAPNACPNPWNGIDGAEVAPRLAAFAESFPRNAVGDLCASEYTTFFNAAVPEIAAACAAWVPE